MKRVFPILIIALAAMALYFRGSWLPQAPGQFNYLGYVEGETVMIAAPVAGRIVVRSAGKGAAVKAGDALFSLDDATATAEVAYAEAAIRTAEATLANLLTGKRDPELAMIAAQKQEAEAGLDLARKELRRAARLTTTGTAAQSRLDQAEAQIAIYEARIAQLEASGKSAALPARGMEIEAARSRIAEARAMAVQARQKLADLTPTAPVDAEVENTFFDPGEWVSAGQPVVSLLAADAITLRFFVPETVVALARPGRKVTFTCDGCGAPQTAAITHAATAPEFTPPVIYSQGARAKLVFLVEAAPDAPNQSLRPGLPIEVEPLQ